MTPEHAISVDGISPLNDPLNTVPMGMTGTQEEPVTPPENTQNEPETGTTLAGNTSEEIPQWDVNAIQSDRIAPLTTPPMGEIPPIPVNASDAIIPPPASTPPQPDDHEVKPMSVKVTKGTHRTISEDSGFEGVTPHAYAVEMLTNHRAYKQAKAAVARMAATPNGQQGEEITRLRDQLQLARQGAEQWQEKAVVYRNQFEEQADIAQQRHVTIRILTDQLKAEANQPPATEPLTTVVPPVAPEHTEADSPEIIQFREFIADLQQTELLLKRENGELRTENEALDQRIGELLTSLSSPERYKNQQAAVKEAKDKYFQLVNDLCDFASRTDGGLIRHTKAYFVTEAQRLYAVYFPATK